MNKIYYILSCLLLLSLCVACHKEESYELLIRYNGECYHYSEGKTILTPEKEVGAIQSITGTDGVLPKEELQVSTTDETYWVGRKLYMNSDEDMLYIPEDDKVESGEIIYRCYVEGKQKVREPETALVPPYVRYGGKTWLLQDKVKKIPKSYTEADRIHSAGIYYSETDNSADQYKLLGGKIYVSEEITDVIYVESISEEKYKQGIWKCVAE